MESVSTVQRNVGSSNLKLWGTGVLVTEIKTLRMMKTQNLRRLLLGLALVGSATAQTTVNFPDATGDVAVPGNPFPHLDITSVDVTVNAAATTITFKINLAGDPTATNWGKYCVAIRSNLIGGDAAGNGWGRPIAFSSGMTHWLGSWVDNGTPPASGQVFTYSGASWIGGAFQTVTRDASSVSITVPVGTLSLDAGEAFTFDVYTTGGGGSDGAVDSLSASTASISNWGDTFTTTVPLSFTMPGTQGIPNAWLSTYFTPTEIAQRPNGPAADGADPDADTLTNLYEYQIGTNPKKKDTDNDALNDNIETASGVYAGLTSPGTSPTVADSDGDGYKDGEEADGSALGYESNPLIYNYTQGLVVAGSFTTPPWNPTGAATGIFLLQVDETLTGQYQNAYDFNFRAPSAFAYKFTNATDWNASGHVDWGSGPTAGTAVRNGGDLNGIAGATGFHRFFFDTRTGSHTFGRTVFANQAAFLSAYSLGGSGDFDGDGVTNGNEFTANTDPTNADSDSDGINDSADPQPLVATRNVVFQVNMTVATAKGRFNPATNTVKVVGQFDGPWSTSGGITLSDPDSDGIYNGSLAVSGAAGSSFGDYKFFIPGGVPDSYETSSNRSFALASGATQTLPVVYFNNDSTLPGGYSDWATTTYGLSGPSAERTADPDGDGFPNVQEFLFGTSPIANTGSLSEVSQSGGNLFITWFQRSTGSSVYELQESLDLGGWDPSTSTPTVSTNQSGAPSGYQRMEALIPITGGSKFARVAGTE